MHLPTLATGKRFTLPRPPGSADALLIAQLAEREKAAGRITAIVTSDASDAQRLLEEIGFSRPICAAPCSRTGKLCPTTAFRRTKT
jgi:transcription-repair coupling factor (superfamily II helicase)